jgi:hypothetical protein
MQTLRDLHVLGPHITDDGLKELARLPRLETLIIECPQVTDAGLRHLTPLRNLRFLNCSRLK